MLIIKVHEVRGCVKCIGGYVILILRERKRESKYEGRSDLKEERRRK